MHSSTVGLTNNLNTHHILRIIKTRADTAEHEYMNMSPPQLSSWRRHWATVTTQNTKNIKHYIGMTATTFKELFRNHTKSFRNQKDVNETELSKHIWNLKEKKRNFTITWSILKHANSYSRGSKRCNLCL